MRVRPVIGRIFLLLCAIVGAGAGAPLTSPRPVPRPALDLPAAHPSIRAQEAGLGVILQNLLGSPPQRQIAGTPGVIPELAIALSPRPAPRPASVTQAAAQIQPDRRAGRLGAICGNPRIQGEELSAIAGKLPGCGVAEPVRVSSVSGVRLTRPAIMDCTTASALNDWVRGGIRPAVGRRGGGLEALKVIADYSCRTRNNRPGARISEHGKGHAVDVAGIILNNGDLITVLEGWHDRRDRKIIRAMHASACGPFGTVLGPDADRYHQDHIHVDTARYRSGPYCQ